MLMVRSPVSIEHQQHISRFHRPARWRIHLTEQNRRCRLPQNKRHGNSPDSGAARAVRWPANIWHPDAAGISNGWGSTGGDRLPTFQVIYGENILRFVCDDEVPAN